MNEPTDLDQQFIADFNLGGLPAEQQRTVAAKLGAAFETRMSDLIANNLDDAQLETLAGYIEQDDSEAAAAYLQQQLPTYGELLEAEYQAFKHEYADIVQQYPQSA